VQVTAENGVSCGAVVGVALLQSAATPRGIAPRWTESTDANERWPGANRHCRPRPPSNRPARDRSRSLATTRGAETAHADLQAAIVRAVTLGLTDVAQALARRLEEPLRGPNVIDLAAKRGRP